MDPVGEGDKIDTDFDQLPGYRESQFTVNDPIYSIQTGVKTLLPRKGTYIDENNQPQIIDLEYTTTAEVSAYTTLEKIDQDTYITIDPTSRVNSVPIIAKYGAYKMDIVLEVVQTNTYIINYSRPDYDSWSLRVTASDSNKDYDFADAKDVTTSGIAFKQFEHVTQEDVISITARNATNNQTAAQHVEMPLNSTTREIWIIDGESPLIFFDATDINITSPEVSGTDVTFRIASDAVIVYLTGSFNDWKIYSDTDDKSPYALLDADQNGLWEGTFSLPYGIHEYQFQIDQFGAFDGVQNDLLVTDPYNPNLSANQQRSIVVVQPPTPITSPEITSNSVTFRYYAPDATEVSVKGSFNNWNNMAMSPSAADVWEATIALPVGKHEYKFVVDGEEITDPFNLTKSSDESNSVVIVDSAIPIISSEVRGRTATFRYYAPDATTVAVAGSWAPTANEMTKSPDGIWELSLDLDPGKYTYKFQVDNNEVPDPFNSAGEVNIADVLSPVINGKSALFKYYAPHAKTVTVSSTFNGWSKLDDPLTDADADGIWEGTVTDISELKHKYKFVVDGDSLRDPANDQMTDQGNSILNMIYAISPEVAETDVTLRYYAPDAKEVSVEIATASMKRPLTKTENGVWQETLTLTPGDYEYKFIVDGKRVTDPYNSAPLSYTGNSVFVIEAPVEVVSPVVAGKTATFSYYNPTATDVYVVGDFNNWLKTDEMKMTKDSDDVWKITLDLEAGEHQYQFDVDGVLVADSANGEPTIDGNSVVSIADITSPIISGTTATFSYYAPDAQTVSATGSFNNWAAATMTKDTAGVWTVTVKDVATKKHEYNFMVDGQTITDPYNDQPLANGNSTFDVVAVTSPAVAGKTATFRYYAPTAEAVFVAGDFNEWSDTANSMTKSPDGIWEAAIDLKAGEHEYAFMVDGVEFRDPANEEISYNEKSLIYVADVESPSVTGHKVTFRYYAPDAQTVTVASDFNAWSDTANPMSDDDKDGIWEMEIDLKSGIYEYLFVVDGNRVNDPANSATAENGNNTVTIIINVAVESPEVRGKTVTFRYHHPYAKTVTVKGAFNNWSEEAMIKNDDDIWEIAFDLEAGDYEYSFVVDDQEILDPENDDQLSYDGKNLVHIADVKSPEIVENAVTFRYYAPTAEAVSVLGSWTITATKMTKSTNGIWEIMENLPAGTYDYKFVVDSKSVTDPSNPTVDANGNSVVKIVPAVVVKSPEVVGNKATFRYYAPEAKAVSVLGSWNADVNTMVKSADGIWEITVDLTTGTYAYKFIVDNNFVTDPSNPNIDANGNSVVTIAPEIVSPEVAGTKATFRYYAPDAQAVSVAGSWNATEDAMTKSSNGVWEVTLDLAAGDHTYKFVVDGKQVADPSNPDVDANGNSVVTIASEIVSPEVAGTKATFRYYAPDAQAVSVAGSWNATEDAMTKSSNGVWEVTLDLTAGDHTYKFVVDGKHVADPSNPDVDANGNSVVTIAPEIVSPEEAGTKATFRYYAPDAQAVSVAGSWNATEDVMVKSANGVWEVTLDLAAGDHTYKFVVDGKQVADPSNPDVDANGNSVVTIAPEIVSPEEAGTKATFRYYAPDAQAVSVLGSWNATEDAMTKSSNGVWEVTLDLAAGDHTYKFVVDGKQVADPSNPDVDANGNSVVTIAPEIVSPEVAGTTATFRYYAPDAQAVSVAGSWNATEDVMVKSSNGVWEVTLDLTAGEHTYKFVVDSKSVTDPSNPTVDANGNSVVKIVPAVVVKSPEVVGNKATFRYYAPDAQAVSVAGSWNATEDVMVKSANGVWGVTLDLAAGDHTYKFVVDGKQVADHRRRND
ncbi:hypothetical protein [Candidatus Epulonipiscium viviparus]|uniref:hypothetical protein n=1 Tax=Candidatus Epulonipiscium viviparus TaxID=420336 RepID=UPI00273816A9|nr:hypothetical protein [Candidatus Epulopiscium viviparus]